MLIARVTKGKQFDKMSCLKCEMICSLPVSVCLPLCLSLFLSHQLLLIKCINCAALATQNQHKDGTLHKFRQLLEKNSISPNSTNLAESFNTDRVRQCDILRHTSCHVYSAENLLPQLSHWHRA